mgnify:CR=1 FL=1
MSTWHPPRRNLASLAVWDSRVLAVRELAEETGADALQLLDWLQEGGGRLRGAPCRLATAKEASAVRAALMGSSSRRWVHWAGKVHNATDLAIAAGLSTPQLRAHLDQGSCQLRGRAVRWASDAEALEHEVAEVTRPRSDIWVRWRFPGNKSSERLLIEEAAARILVGDNLADPEALLQQLLERGRLHYRDNRIELLNISHTKQITHTPLTVSYTHLMLPTILLV